MHRLANLVGHPLGEAYHCWPRVWHTCPIPMLFRKRRVVFAASCHRMLFVAPIFGPFFEPTSLHVPYPPFFFMSISLCFSFYALFTLMNKWQHFQLYNWSLDNLIYWVTDIPKQSCCGSSPGSCAGTSSTATERSHHSKLWTSWTQSMTLGARGPGNQQKHLEYIAGSGWKYLPLTHW